MHHMHMRTTITLPDETHEFALYYANARGISLSAAVNELIRKAQSAPNEEPRILRSPNGLPLFRPTGRAIVTPEIVKKLSEDEIE